MNEEYNNLESNPPEESNQTEQLSNTDAMAGIFTSPSETFETIADTQKKNYWLLPMIISILIGLVTTFLFMSDAELVSKTMEKQKQVRAGERGLIVMYGLPPAKPMLLQRVCPQVHIALL